MNTIKIEYFQNGQEAAIHDLIKKVYDEFVAAAAQFSGSQFS